MSMKHGAWAGLVAALGLAIAAPVAQADDISTLEGARAKERQGTYLTGQEREQLRRYGGNDDYDYRGSRSYHDGYDGPGVSVYVGPRPYYRPYGY